jgi:hypothetical protein
VNPYDTTFSRYRDIDYTFSPLQYMLGPQAADYDLSGADLMHAKSEIHTCQGDVDLVNAAVVICIAEPIRAML